MRISAPQQPHDNIQHDADHKQPDHHVPDIIEIAAPANQDLTPTATLATSQHHSSSSDLASQLPASPTAAANDARLPTHHEPSFDILDHADDDSRPDERSPDPRADGSPAQAERPAEAEGPVTLRQRLGRSAVVQELTELRPLVASSVRSASSKAVSFGRSSAASLVSYVRCAPGELRDSAVGFRRNPSQLRLEVLLGVSLSALLVVDGIAFAITAGTLPIVGLYACFILTLFTSVFGACPGMASGAAGSTAAVQAAITSDSGSFAHLTAEQRLQVLFFCLLLSGALEVLVGWLGLAQLAILIPYTVMIGFMNGLAIIIFESQLAAFQYCPTSSTFTDCAVTDRRWLPADSLTTWLTVVHALLAMAIMEYAHKIPSRVVRWVPPVLWAAVLGSALEHAVFRAAIHRPTRTIAETAAISGSLPAVAFPSTASLTSGDAGQVVLQAVLVAFVGLVESILTLNALNVKKAVRTAPHDFDRESIAQGVGNVACALTGGLGGCALVGESSLNIEGGSRSRLSTFVSAWCILLYVTALYMVVNLLPIATVTGIMFTIVVHLFQWRSTATAVLRLRGGDALVIYVVTAVSVAVDLAIGVAVGIVLHALLFAYEMGQQPHFAVAVKWADADATAGQLSAKEAAAAAADGASAAAARAGLCTVVVRGVLYFGSVQGFVSGCHPDVLRTAATTTHAAADTDAEAGASMGAGGVSVVLDMHACRLLDFSASCALDDVVSEWRKLGWHVEVSGVDEQQRMRLSLAQSITPSRQLLTWLEDAEQAVTVVSRQ